MTTFSCKWRTFSKQVISCRNTILSSSTPSPVKLTCGNDLKFIRVSSTFKNNGNRESPESYSYSPFRQFTILPKSNGLSQQGLVQPISIRPYASHQQIHQNTQENVEETLSIAQKLVGNLPHRSQLYLKLSRVDRPIGTWLLFWPSTWGLAAASGGLPDLKLLALFGAGAFVMRGAGCTVNDMWDRHIDPKVRRTSSRPLASRQLRMRHAAVWLGGQLSIAFGILHQLNPSCFLISCGALGLVCLYPLAKRVTYWPQAVLGLTFNTGILIGYAAACPTDTGFFGVPYLDAPCLYLYCSGILWTLIYDTIYAHQDLQDDALLGLGSTARRFGDNTKIWLSGFSCLMVSSLTMAGVTADLSWLYYAGVTGVAGHLLWQIKTLNIKDATNCGDRFTANRHIGWLIFLSILASFWMQNYEHQNFLEPNKIKLETEKSLSVTI